MLDEKFEQSQTSSNIVQHRPTLSNMFDCAVQMGQTLYAQQCLTNMFDQFERAFNEIIAKKMDFTFGNDVCNLLRNNFSHWRGVTRCNG